MQLHEQRDLYRDRAAEAMARLDQFERHLTSAKFQGHCPTTGIPNDHIQCADVIRWLDQNLRPLLMGREDDTLGATFDALVAMTLVAETDRERMESMRRYVAID
jgi:hypothetical protein